MYNPTDIELEKLKLKSVISNLREGIIIVDFNKNIVEFNNAAETMTGFTRGEVFGRAISDVIKFFDADKEIYPEIYAPISEIEMDGIVFSKDQINLIDKNNKLNIVNIQSSRIRGGSRINLGCIIKLDNVSAESELERMKLDFVSMSVHTLRTPVTIVRGFISQLLNPTTLAKLSDNEKEMLTSAMTGSNQLKDLIEKILTMSELQQGGGFAKFTTFDMDNLIQLVLKEFRHAATEKNLSIKYIPPMSKLPMVKGDILKIEEVLRRLIDNAVAFTSEGGIEVKIYQKDAQYLEVSIADSGKGIPEKNLPHVFDKFYRIKTALEMEQGQGISLYICKKIIDNHKGNIWVQSLEGQGSIFYFTVPVSKDVK